MGSWLTEVQSMLPVLRELAAEIAIFVMTRLGRAPADQRPDEEAAAERGQDGRKRIVAHATFAGFQRFRRILPRRFEHFARGIFPG